MVPLSSSEPIDINTYCMHMLDPFVLKNRPHSSLVSCRLIKESFSPPASLTSFYLCSDACHYPRPPLLSDSFPITTPAFILNRHLLFAIHQLFKMVSLELLPMELVLDLAEHMDIASLKQFMTTNKVCFQPRKRQRESTSLAATRRIDNAERSTQLNSM